MKSRFLVFAALCAAMCAGFSSCDTEDGEGGTSGGSASVINATVEDGNDYNSEIATVKALIVTDEDRNYKWVGYELATGSYKNGKFKLNLPSTVPDEYLEHFEDADDGSVSDPKAQITSIRICAYDEDGYQVGEFKLRSKDTYCGYVYVDRNVTVKHNGSYIIDWSFKKGWNIIYISGDKKTSKKPSGTFKWHFDSN